MYERSKNLCILMSCVGKLGASKSICIFKLKMSKEIKYWDLAEGD